MRQAAPPHAHTGSSCGASPSRPGLHAPGRTKSFPQNSGNAASMGAEWSGVLWAQGSGAFLGGWGGCHLKGWSLPRERQLSRKAWFTLNHGLSERGHLWGHLEAPAWCRRPWAPRHLAMGERSTWAGSCSPVAALGGLGVRHRLTLAGSSLCSLPQLLQRQGAQLWAQTLSRSCFLQWRQQVGT